MTTKRIVIAGGFVGLAAYAAVASYFGWWQMAGYTELACRAPYENYVQQCVRQNPDAELRCRSDAVILVCEGVDPARR